MYGLVWAGPGSFATTTGVLSFPRGTEMFQFPRWPPPRLCVQREVVRHDPDGVAPFGDPRLRLLAAGRGLSQRCHVLLRLSTPRHPPYALSCLCRAYSGASGCGPAHGDQPSGWLGNSKRTRRWWLALPGRGAAITLVLFLFMSTTVLSWKSAGCLLLMQLSGFNRQSPPVSSGSARARVSST